MILHENKRYFRKSNVIYERLDNNSQAIPVVTLKQVFVDYLDDFNKDVIGYMNRYIDLNQHLVVVHHDVQQQQIINAPATQSDNVQFSFF